LGIRSKRSKKPRDARFFPTYRAREIKKVLETMEGITGKRAFWGPFFDLISLVVDRVGCCDK
jgi:hypothetical protein